MKIETLNSREHEEIAKFQLAYRNIIKSAVRVKGLTPDAIIYAKKRIKLLARSIVKSGLGMGAEWLESSLQEK